MPRASVSEVGEFLDSMEDNQNGGPEGSAERPARDRDTGRHFILAEDDRSPAPEHQLRPAQGS